MPALADVPAAPLLAGPRLDLEPLRVRHAEEMAVVLDDPALHEFIGGEPATVEQLQRQYSGQVPGRSPDGSQRWFNWVLRRRCDRRAVGTVQATVSREDQLLTAEVAWVVGTAHQGRGYAKESAAAMVTWLRRCGIEAVVAHVHPEHPASQAVARAVGLHPTATLVDGEVRWHSEASQVRERPGMRPRPR